MTERAARPAGAPPAERPADAPPADWLPGDLPPAERVARILRVDHAGEYGARRIYDGQLAVLGRGSPAHAAIRAMAEQERRHLEAFERLIVERRVRPSALLPLWHVAGFALGAATALLGERAAMACTIAVEEVIDGHYARQAGQLAEREPELGAQLAEFRADELEHRDRAIAEGGEDAPGYTLLRSAIKVGSRLAIWLSERI